VRQYIEDASLMVLAKNKQKFFAGNGIKRGSVLKTAEYCWCALHFSAMVTTFALFCEI